MVSIRTEYVWDIICQPLPPSRAPRHWTWCAVELKVKFRVHGWGTSPTSDTYRKLRHATRPAMTHTAKHCQCSSEKGNFVMSRCKRKFFWIFWRFRLVMQRCVISATKARATILGHFFYENSIWRQSFQFSGGWLFPITSHFADAHVYKMTNCVSGFRDYMYESEGYTDASQRPRISPR